MDRRSLLGLWGRGDDCGEISGEDGADLKKNDITNLNCPSVSIPQV